MFSFYFFQILEVVGQRYLFPRVDVISVKCIVLGLIPTVQGIVLVEANKIFLEEWM